MGNSKKSAVTLDDVAALAGYSRITVSRALASDPDAVSASTRTTIERAAAQLGYIPNLAASALTSRRSGLVVALVPTLSTSTFSTALDALRSTLARHDLQLLVGAFGYENESEAAILRSALGRQPDAIVMFSSVHSPEARALLDATKTLVIEAWDPPGTRDVFTVGFDNRAGGILAAKHLLERRQRLAFVTAAASGSTVGAYRTEKRWLGFAHTVRARLGIEPAGLALDHPLTYLGGRAALRSLLELHPKIDGVFFAYDEWAAGAVFECVAMGIKVPKQLAICGFGGLPIAFSMEPRLTTVAIPMEEIGTTAARAVVDVLAGSSVKRKPVKLPLKLVLGATT